MSNDKHALRRAQANMLVTAGIAIGIILTKEGGVDPGMTYYGNAIKALSDFDDDYLSEMVKSLQTHINDEEEKRIAALTNKL